MGFTKLLSVLLSSGVEIFKLQGVGFSRLQLVLLSSGVRHSKLSFNLLSSKHSSLIVS